MAARAHDPGLSSAEGQLRRDVLAITTGFAPADVQELLPAAFRTGGTWTEAEFETARDHLLEIAPTLWRAEVGGIGLEPIQPRVELLPGDNVSFHVVFRRLARSGPLVLHAPQLSRLPAGHRQFVIIADEAGSTIAKKLLSAKDPTIQVPAPSPTSSDTSLGAPQEPASAPPAAASGGFGTFLKLGIEHIWTGYDHLLFLFALLLVCRSFRSMAAIVTCFTLAHSLTLGLATLDLVRLPSRWVEAAIAASIVYVGLENLWLRGKEPRRRWALTFAFGLVHGFGFATVLRDLGIGGRGGGVGMPLFSFNLGVELGQIALATVVLPIVWQLRRREWFLRVAVPALSAIVALAGLYWLLQRTVFG